MKSIKIFTSNTSIEEIKSYFQKEKKPFIVKKIINPNIDLDFLFKKFKNEEIISLNPNSDKETLSVSELIFKIKNGEKYRLRANTKLGNKITQYIDTSFIDKIKNKKKTFLIMLFHMAKQQDKRHSLLAPKIVLLPSMVM